MSCDSYNVSAYDGERKDWYETSIEFPQSGDIGCLCTFGGKLDARTVAKLALLGAAMVLLHHGEIAGPVYLPMGMPDLYDDICKFVPGGDE